MSKLNKGSVVRCVESRDNYITKGKLYSVEAVEGDPDLVCGGTVEESGFIITNDRDNPIYALYPECSFGVWEIVK